MNYVKVCHELRDTERGIEWSVKHNLLPAQDKKKCVCCDKVEIVMWRKKSRNLNFPYSLIYKECSKGTSLVKNTWFEHSKLTILQNLQLVYLWLLKVNVNIWDRDHMGTPDRMATQKYRKSESKILKESNGPLKIHALKTGIIM